MADVVNETLKEIAQNATIKGSKEGIVVAYSSIVVMALIPIFFGSFRSVKHLKEKRESGEKPDLVTHKDAAMFPVYASVALVGLYVFFKVFSKEYIDLLIAVYFYGLGVMSLTYILRPIVRNLLPDRIDAVHTVVYTRFKGEEKEEVANYTFTNKDIVALSICGLVGSVYLFKKHWVMNNVFGLAFALLGVELLLINNVIIGCTLLGGLFIYDIFWVFGTDVMVSVAKSFEAPIKLVFPQDIFENWLDGRNFAMLGLGDIVIPGLFIALLLRFDKTQNRKHYLYFYTSFFAYFVGLIFTICIMSYFKHAQPALLYLVPACIGTPLLIAFLKGDINALFKYEDEKESESKESTPDTSSSTSSSLSEGAKKEVKKDK